MRGERRSATSRLRADSVWGVERYFEEQLAFFSRWLRDDAAGRRPTSSASHLRDGRRLGPPDGRGQARPRRPLARRARVAARPRGRRRRSTSTATARSRREPPTVRSTDTVHLRPGPSRADDRRHHCAVRELPAEGPGIEQTWARFLSPVPRLRDVVTPGPADQNESPASSARAALPAALRAPRCAGLPDRAADRGGRGDRGRQVHLWVSSRAMDTDFTAKLIDVYPAERGYPRASTCS